MEKGLSAVSEIFLFLTEVLIGVIPIVARDTQRSQRFGTINIVVGFY
jgi:hypothetical protein